MRYEVNAVIGEPMGLRSLSTKRSYERQASCDVGNQAVVQSGSGAS